jgi:hypothetical protein
MKKLIRLIEAGEKTAFVKTAKGEEMTIDYKDTKDLKHMADNSDIKAIKTATGDFAKGTFTEEAGKKYTTQESTAVGKEVAKSLVKVLRGQGDEVTNVKLTGLGVNSFNIHVTYGNEKGEDTFKFKLNPESEDIHIETEQGDEPLTDFLITQGNTVSLPTPELESKLADIMKKYVSEPAPADMEDSIMEADFNDPIAMKLRAAKMAKPQPAPIKQKPAIDNSAKIKALEKERERIMFDMEQEAEPEGGPIADRYGVMLNRIDNAINKLRGSNQEKDVDISQAEIERRARMIKENTSETTKRVGGKYVNYPEKGGERLGTFSTKKAAQKQLAAIEISKQKKNEALDPVGKEDKDINNDGKVDSTDKYLKHRRDVISQNMTEATNPELTKYVNRFVGGLAKMYDYSTQDAVDAIMGVLRSQGWKGINEDLDLGHQDDEPGMLLGDLYSIMQSTKELYEMVSQFEGQGEVDFPHWWQAKVIKAKSCLHAAKQYLDFEINKPQQVQKVQIATLGEVTPSQTQTGEGKVDVNTLKRKFRELSTSTISGLSTNEVELLLQLIPAMVNKGAGGSTETALKDVAKIYNIRTASIEPKP